MTIKGPIYLLVFFASFSSLSWGNSEPQNTSGKYVKACEDCSDKSKHQNPAEVQRKLLNHYSMESDYKSLLNQYNALKKDAPLIHKKVFFETYLEKETEMLEYLSDNLGAPDKITKAEQIKLQKLKSEARKSRAAEYTKQREESFTALVNTLYKDSAKNLGNKKRKAFLLRMISGSLIDFSEKSINIKKAFNDIPPKLIQEAFCFENPVYELSAELLADDPKGYAGFDLKACEAN